MSSSLPIGVFDSGVGGLTVLKALCQRLPGEDFIYLGDTARVPYGRKPPEMVRGFATQITNFLVHQGVKAVVIACNTATSVVLPDLEKSIPVPVWGVIEPGVAAARAVLSEKQNLQGRVGVIATTGTVRTRAYQSRLEALGIEVWARACPLFVPLVEEGLVDSEEAKLVVHHYLKDRPELDALILACTHYPVLKNLIAAELGPNTALVDSAEAIANVVAQGLKQKQALNQRALGGSVLHFVTGDPSAYRHTSSVIGGVDGEIKLLELEKLVSFEKGTAHV